MNRSWVTGVLAGVCVGAIVFALTGALHAQGTPSSDCCVACLNVGTVFDEYQRTKDFREELNRFQEQLKAEDKTRMESIDIMQNTLDNMAPDDPAYKKKMNELLEASVSYKTWRELQEAHKLREVALGFDRIYREIIQTAEEIALASGYDVVLYYEDYRPVSMNPEEIQAQMRARKVIYASPRVDVSQIVLGRLNSTYRAQPPTPQLQVP